MDFLANNKFLIISSPVLVLLPYYTWKSFFSLWQELKNKHNQNVLFYERHNRVVTYQSSKGLGGWLPNLKRTQPTDGINIFEQMCEPILYFIETSKKSLDIAIMIVNVKVIYKALIEARKRGVAVRVITNFHHCESSKEDIKFLKKQGVKYQIFVQPNANLDSIMHHKFIIKDYQEIGGYLCTGSLNLSSNSVLNNYEDMVFSSNAYLVEKFKNEFEKCWEDIKIDNEGLINRTILMDAGFF